MKKVLIRERGHRPLLAALLRAGIGSPDKYGKRVRFPVEFDRENMSWVYADDSVYYHGCDVEGLVCRGLWVDPVADRDRFARYIATAPERKDYPGGNWVFGTNIHNTVSVEAFDWAVNK